MEEFPEIVKFMFSGFSLVQKRSNGLFRILIGWCKFPKTRVRRSPNNCLEVAF